MEINGHPNGRVASGTARSGLPNQIPSPQREVATTDSTYARFDDLRPHRRRSFQLTNAQEVIETSDPEAVPAVLAQVEDAVVNGYWVAGFVAYEAAPGLDDALQVPERSQTGFAALPVAWFAVFPDRSPVDEEIRGAYSLGEWSSNVSEAAHRSGVETIQNLIRLGRTYQVNYTFGLSTDFAGAAGSFYRDLIDAQTCGYGAFLDTGRWQVASASPELFFEWDGSRIVCRPMKGTAARGRRTTDDEASRLALVASEKDRAENVMIVDMVRNDLGRVAEVGTVDTPALFSVEKYDTVWQLTSTVAATTRPQTSLVDVFAALFPSASITGAPKVATMEIIRDLEAGPRGVYCGTIGFGGPGLDGNPEWAFNVAIRTVLIDRDRGTAYYGTGGGITIDSTPAGEYREARLKAEVLARRTAEFRILETVKFDPNTGAWLADRHFDRMLDSAWYFDVPIDRSDLEVALKEATAGRPRAGVVRLLLDRSGLIETEVLPIPDETSEVRLVVDDRPVDRADPLLYHKTTNRTVYDEALARHPGSDDVVLWNEAREVTETTVGNLAVLIDGGWVTPPVESGCLPGTYRAELLEQGRLTERVVTIADLNEAEALARINSVRGWQDAVLDR